MTSTGESRPPIASRGLSAPPGGADLLRGRTVAVLGLGGLANHVLPHLLAMNVSRLLLADFDRVQTSDLHRQLFFAEQDIGRPKAAAMRERLLERRSDLDVDARELRLTSAAQIAALMDGVDFVVRSADSPPEIDNWINEACLRRRVPFVIAGTMEQKALLGPLVVPFETACVSCSETVEFADRVGEANRRRVVRYNRVTPVLAPMLGYLGDVMSEEIRRFFTDSQTCRLTRGFYLIDFMTLHWRFLRTVRRSDCEVCGTAAAGSLRVH